MQDAWYAIVKAANGEAMPKMNSTKIDVFVCFEPPPEPAVQQHAASQGKPLVTKEWLCQSLISQSCLPFKPFLISGAKSASIAAHSKRRRK